MGLGEGDDDEINYYFALLIIMLRCGIDRIPLVDWVAFKFYTQRIFPDLSSCYFFRYPASDQL